jgi:hypothetical protein
VIEDTYNAVLVLQNCTESLKILPVSSDEVCLTLSNDANGAVGIKVEEGTNLDMKEEIPESKLFPTIKDEQDEVSYVSVCLLANTFPRYKGMPAVFVISISQAVHIKQLDSCVWGLGITCCLVKA